MTEEQDKYLCEKYPKLFAKRNAPMNESCMHWGFNCGSGWFSIVDELCRIIQNHIDQSEEEAARLGVDALQQVVVEQVKEKYAGLRFYYSGGDEFIAGLVSMAEGISGRMCESCGAPGKTTGKGWLKTLCENCQKKE